MNNPVNAHIKKGYISEDRGGEPLLPIVKAMVSFLGIYPAASGALPLEDILALGNDANGVTITNLPEPTADTEVATKKYVDDNAGGITISATEYDNNADALAALGVGVLYKSSSKVNGSPIILITI